MHAELPKQAWQFIVSSSQFPYHVYNEGEYKAPAELLTELRGIVQSHKIILDKRDH